MKSIIAKELESMLTVPPLPYKDGWQAEYILTPDFVGFKGHFDGYPLLPAFIQIILAGHMLGKAGAATGNITEIPNAKFTGQAKPGDTISIRCLPYIRKNGPGQAWDVQLINSADQSPVAAFKIYFQAE